MPKRKCDGCGKEKEVRGGKVCSNGHFICSSCIGSGFFGGRTTCPLCGKLLK